MCDLLALAERCEKATGPDRELDWLIAEAIGEVPKHSVRDIGWDYDWFRRPGEFVLWKATDSEGRNVDFWRPDERTGSINAAMTLVSEGMRRLVRDGDPDNLGSKLPYAHVGFGYDSNARTMALALCAAALRARASAPTKAPSNVLPAERD